MREPTMPGYTCPVIDKIKRAIESAYELADADRSNDKEDDLRQRLRDIAHELRGEDDALEKVRDANSQLRTCAEYWEAEANRLASEYEPQ